MASLEQGWVFTPLIRHAAHTHILHCSHASAIFLAFSLRNLHATPLQPKQIRLPLASRLSSSFAAAAASSVLFCKRVPRGVINTAPLPPACFA